MTYEIYYTNPDGSESTERFTCLALAAQRRQALARNGRHVVIGIRKVVYKSS